MSQEIYKLLPFLKPISGSAKTTPEQKTQALQRQSAEQIRQGGGLTGQTKTKELYKLLPFLQPAAGNSQPKASGTKIKIGDKYYDTGFHSKEIAELRKKYPGGGNAAQSTAEFQPPVISDPGPPSPSADPRNDAYLSARAKLTKDSTAEDIKKVENIGMTAWAKANPELAAEVKPGQSGYEQIFADKRKEKVMDMMKTLNNPNIKPIVENINIPSTNFTGNLTGGISGIDYKDVMQDGAITELAKGLDLEAPQFNPQDFMNAFRDDVINVEKTQQKNGLGKVLDLPDVNKLLSTLGKDEYFRQLDAGLLTK